MDADSTKIFQVDMFVVCLETEFDLDGMEEWVKGGKRGGWGGGRPPLQMG